MGTRRLPAPRLRMLWTMLTHVHGNLLNVSDLARSLSVSSHTVADHLDVLESTFMVRRITPHFANIQKRLTKSPKIYVRDTGLLHFLAGLRHPKDVGTALVLCGDRPQVFPFVCLDARLRDAASAEGFEVLPQGTG